MARKKKKVKPKTWRRLILIVFAALALIFVLGLSVAALYKKEIVSYVNQELKTALRTEVRIYDADITFITDFPNITLLLKDVTIGTDSISTRQALNARRIHLNLRTFKLLFGKIEFRSVRVHDADVYVVRTMGGISNIDFLRREKTDTVERPSPLIFERQHVILQNCKVSYHDSLKRKYYDVTFGNVDGRLVANDSTMSIALRGPVEFGGLVFNPDRGAFLRDAALNLDLRLLYRRDSAIVEILPSTAKAPAGLAAISGRMKFSEPKKMQLTFSTEEVEYAKGIDLLADTIKAQLAKLNITGPMKVRVDLMSDLIPGVKPAADVRFSFAKNRLLSDKMDVTNLSLQGHFTNHIDDRLPYENPNSLVHLTEVSGEIDGLPFRAEAKLINPADLRLELHSIHSFDLARLNRQADTTVLKFTKGTFTSEFRYNGKLKEYLDPTVKEYSGNLDGTMSIKDGAFTVVGRRLKFSDFHSSVHFTEDTVTIKSLGMKTGKSSVEIKGTVLNYVPLFVQPEGKGYVTLNITSPYLDVGSLLSSGKEKMSAKRAAKQKKKVSDMLDVIFKNLQFNVKFNVKKYVNNSFAGSNLSGEFRLRGTSLDARNVKMDFGHGKLTLDASMKNLQNKVNPVELTAKMTGVHIKELFTAFNNFGQKTITDENLHGHINMDARLKTRIDDDFNVVLPTLTGKVSLVVFDGRLVNFEPLARMGNFLFKKRDFEDVKFAQINGHFDVAARDLDIERMEIESTVLTLFLEGRYSLDNHTDLTIQVPLSNLKRRDKSYVPQKVGEDSKVGPSVFLRAQSNEKGETTISYELFKKKKKGK